MLKVFYVISFILFVPALIVAQNKRPLTHEDYDDWKSINEKRISNNGQYIAFTINPQEGDGLLRVEHLQQNKFWEIPRGYNLKFTNDSKFLIAAIKPLFQDTRQAKIKKKKPDDMPKDSIVLLNLETGVLTKTARVKSYKIPEKGHGWIAYQLEKPLPDTTKKKKQTDSTSIAIAGLARLADSIIRKSLDSVEGKIEKKHVVKAANKAAKEIYKRAKDFPEEIAITDAPFADESEKSADAGTTVTLINSITGGETVFKHVAHYFFDEQANVLLLQTKASKKKPATPAMIVWHDLKQEKSDTIMKGFNEAVKFAFDDAGTQLAFLAETDSNAKADPAFYALWYFQKDLDSAEKRVTHHSPGIQMGMAISENSNVRFNKNGDRLFFGTAPVKPAKDTSLIDFEQAKLDIWHYNDDYLQPQQLKRLTQSQQRSYDAVLLLSENKLVQLGAEDAESVVWVNEGNADWVLGYSNKGNRRSAQWEGRSLYNIFKIDVRNGKRTQILKNTLSRGMASPSGKYVYWYDLVLQDYFVYDVASEKTINVTNGIKEPLYDIENDVPDYARPMGVEGWMKDDAGLLIKGQYDIWMVDPTGRKPAENLTNGYGKKHQTEFNYISFSNEKRFIEPNETIILASFNKHNKYGGFFSKSMATNSDPLLLTMVPHRYSMPIKAKDTGMFLVQGSDIRQTELYAGNSFSNLKQRTHISDQRNSFVWPTAELVRWKMFDGKMSEGILYKPDNFDPTKKYPVLFYFYERNADGLYNFKTPAPSASIINIPYFVSNGYVVFDPNIYYKKGEPGESAYNSVVSAAQFLADKHKWVDRKRMGIQGQSWGGYQVSYLVTRTNMFAAAGAGAPVANMTSAYGGIRWGSGMNRQFQYEKTQSRIGATLWERPDLYLKNSPLFQADKIKTPLLIMHNDADGSVPWYQGIELFTAMRRLDKKVWMLQYNGEDHNLIQRRNRKDLSIRLSQFFDYYLKDAPPAKWIIDGVPATDKGIDWGLDVY